MKYDNNKIFIVLCLAVILLGTGCKKNDYLTGGSLHEAITPLKNMDYLKSNSFKIFDTVTAIIEKFNLSNEVNDAKTFFAFTDYAVLNMINVKLAAKQTINPLATYTLDSLVKDMTADSIRQYIATETLDLDNSPELKAKPFTSKGNTSMGVLKQLQTGTPYTDRTKAPTYLLYFVKVRGALDEPGVIPPVNENDFLVLCQTTGIKTSNGATTLHVLSNSHTFVRF